MNEDTGQDIEWEVQERGFLGSWDWLREVKSQEMGEKIVGNNPNLRLVKRTVVTTTEASE